MAEDRGLALDPAALQRLNRLTLAAEMLPAGVHAINGSLALVKGSLEFLLRRLDGRDSLSEAARDALEGTHRLEETVRLLRAAAWSAPARREAVDLSALVSDAQPGIAMMLAGGVRLELGLEPCPPVRGDPAQLTRLLLNLVANAGRAANLAEGPARVHILTAPSGAAAQLSVSDSGPGVSPRDLARAFDPLYTAWPDAPGAGLGLAASRAIARAHGGELTLRRADGETRADLLLPVLVAASSRGRVLLVDDEVRVLGAFGRLLGRQHEVVTRSSGNAAAALLAEDGAFSVILSDLVMADGTGRDLHRWISANRPELLPRLVFVTAGAFGHGYDGFLRQAGLPVVEKPVEPDVLRALVGRYVARFPESSC